MKSVVKQCMGNGSGLILSSIIVCSLRGIANTSSPEEKKLSICSSVDFFFLHFLKGQFQLLIAECASEIEH